MKSIIFPCHYTPIQKMLECLSDNDEIVVVGSWLGDDPRMKGVDYYEIPNSLLSLKFRHIREILRLLILMQTFRPDIVCAMRYPRSMVLFFLLIGRLLKLDISYFYWAVQAKDKIITEKRKANFRVKIAFDIYNLIRNAVFSFKFTFEPNLFARLSIKRILVYPDLSDFDKSFHGFRGLPYEKLSRIKSNFTKQKYENIVFYNPNAWRTDRHFFLVLDYLLERFSGMFYVKLHPRTCDDKCIELEKELNQSFYDRCKISTSMRPRVSNDTNVFVLDSLSVYVELYGSCDYLVMLESSGDFVYRDVLYSTAKSHGIKLVDYLNLDGD